MEGPPPAPPGPDPKEMATIFGEDSDAEGGSNSTLQESQTPPEAIAQPKEEEEEQEPIDGLAPQHIQLREPEEDRRYPPLRTTFVNTKDPSGGFKRCPERPLKEFGR